MTIPIEIYVKTSDNLEQFRYASQLNPNLEWQLLQNFQSHTWSLAPILEELKQNPTIRLNIIHTPLLSQPPSDVDLKDLEDYDIYHLLYQTFEVAQQVAKVQKSPVLVVAHYSGSVERLFKTPVYAKLLASRLERLLLKFPDVSLGIENVVPIDSHGETREGGYALDTPRLVAWLRQTLSIPDRLFSVLDTCHVLATQRLFEKCSLPYLELSSYFEAFTETVGLIHLANVRELGFGFFEHGVGFTTEDDFNLLRELLSLYQAYGYTCPVTIEVQEHNYLCRDEYLKTIEQLGRLFRC